MYILLLPLLVKVLDKLIYEQTIANFLTENKFFVFFVCQVYLPGYLLTPKGFDIINHGILWVKLTAVDFSTDVAPCFELYRLDLAIVSSIESRYSGGGLLQGSVISGMY